MSNDTDRYVIRCNDFSVAAAYAAQMDWRIAEWSWAPAYTVHKNIQVYARVDNDYS